MNARALALIVLVALSGVTAIHYSDDLQQVFESWRSGEAKALITLDIKVPRVDADECILEVARYPSMYLPNNGTLEELYIGPASPGSIVNVKKFIPAIPVKTRYDEARGSYIVEYYEPQEFLVIVGCFKGNTTVFEFGRNIEVYPRNLVHREEVDIAALAEKYRKESIETGLKPATPENGRVEALMLDPGSGGSSPAFSCNITIDRDTGDYRHGYCYTYVAGPYLYSINGMSTSFGLVAVSRPSAVYLESFYSLKNDYDPQPEVPSWTSSGKTLAYSVVDRQTPGLSGNSKVQIYFRVKYEYERSVVCRGYTCYYSHKLYPTEIRWVYRADEIGAGSVKPYTPPSTAPNYATIGSGSASIVFGSVYVSDTPSVSTGVSFSLSYGYLWWSVTLTVDFYKAGRNDNQYIPPYVSISAPGNFWYYWWYNNDDSMTYEILFKPYP